MCTIDGGSTTAALLSSGPGRHERLENTDSGYVATGTTRSTVTSVSTSLIRLASVLIAVALGAAACSSGDDGADVSAAPAVDRSGVETETDGTTSLLDISASTADGSTIDLSDYAGQDLMLWFWAPW